jgi:hypothetical protein
MVCWFFVLGWTAQSWGGAWCLCYAVHELEITVYWSRKQCMLPWTAWLLFKVRVCRVGLVVYQVRFHAIVQVPILDISLKLAVRTNDYDYDDVPISSTLKCPDVCVSTHMQCGPSRSRFWIDTNSFMPSLPKKPWRISVIVCCRGTRLFD